MADHDTPKIDKLDKLRHPLDADNPDSVNSPLNRFQHPLSTDGSNSVNPLNAGGESLSLPEVKESLAGKMCEPASSESELPLGKWIILHQASLSLFIQMIEQKVEQLPDPNEELQSEARKLRTNQRASASTVLNWLLHELTVCNEEEDEEIIQSELLHGLLMALKVRLDDKPIRSKEKARVDYNYVTILVASREASPPSSSKGQQSQNSTSMSSSVLHEPIGLFVYLNPYPQNPMSTTPQYICSETKPFVIALTAN